MPELKKVKIKFSEKRHDVILLQDRISKTSKRSLRPALRSRRITPYSRNIQPIPVGAVVVNFGATEVPVWIRPDMVLLNTPDAIRDSSNKLQTFAKLKAALVPTVRWSVDREEVKGWLAKGHKALARIALASSGGRGIRVLEGTDDPPPAPLYTRYFPKTHEFRVHVVGGEAVDLVEKKAKLETEENRVIRNHRNGWVFAHDNLSVTDPNDVGALKALGIQALGAVGLDFGAVDILACLDDANPRRLTKYLVCEVNAAPGIENEATKLAYVKGLNKLIESKRAEANK